jgi:hypothetical protein
VHDAEHVSCSVPQLPHPTFRVAPGEHAPEPTHVPVLHVHDAEHVSCSVPQFPHATMRVAPGEHAPEPMHVPAVHVHDAEHVSCSMPQFPHATMRVAPGEHAPEPVHVPAVHVHDAEHVSCSIPQFPHATMRVAPGLHGPEHVSVGTTSRTSGVARSAATSATSRRAVVSGYTDASTRASSCAIGVGVTIVGVHVPALPHVCPTSSQRCATVHCEFGTVVQPSEGSAHAMGRKIRSTDD